MRIAAFALTLLIPVSLLAEGPLKNADLVVSGFASPKLLGSITCGSDDASRTWTSAPGEISGWKTAIFQLDLGDADSGVTGLGVLPTTKILGSSNWGKINPCDDTTDGSCDLAPSGDFLCTTTNNCVSGTSTVMIFRVDVTGLSDLKLFISCQNGDTGDTLALYGRLSE